MSPKYVKYGMHTLLVTVNVIMTFVSGCFVYVTLSSSKLIKILLQKIIITKICNKQIWLFAYINVQTDKTKPKHMKNLRRPVLRIKFTNIFSENKLVLH